MPKSEFVNFVRAMANPGVFARGQGYFREGRVRITFREKDHVEAEVKGSRTYACGFWLEDNKVGAMCDCPYTEEDGDICKHLVALALTMESSGIVISRNTGDIAVSAFPEGPEEPKKEPRSLPRSASQPPSARETGLDGDEEPTDDEFDFDPFPDDDDDSALEIEPKITGPYRIDEKQNDKADESEVAPPKGQILQLPNRPSNPTNEWWKPWTELAHAAAHVSAVTQTRPPAVESN